MVQAKAQVGRDGYPIRLFRQKYNNFRIKGKNRWCVTQSKNLQPMLI